MTTAETKDATGAATAAGAAGEQWSGAGEPDFDNLEKEASKLIALWELVPSGESAPQDAKPASPAEEGWSAAVDPSVTTLPDPETKAAAAPAVEAPAAAATATESAPAAAPAAASASTPAAIPTPKRVPKKTLMAGSLGPANDNAPQTAAPAAAPAASSTASPSGGKGWTGAAAPVGPSIDEGAPRASVAPDTVIDARPLSASTPPPVYEEPVVIPRSRPVLPMALAATALLAAGVVGFWVVGSGSNPPPVRPSPAAAVAAAPPTPAPPVALAPTPAAAALVAPAVAPTAPVVEPTPLEPGVAAPAALVDPAVAVAVAPPVPVVEPVVEAPPVVEPPPAPEMHALRVRVEPSSATVTVDGSPVTLPYSERFGEGTSHVIVARADGYTEGSRTIELGDDETVTLRLERSVRISTSVGGSRSGGSRSGGSRSGGSRSGGSRSGGSRSGGSRSGGSRSGGGIVTESPY